MFIQIFVNLFSAIFKNTNDIDSYIHVNSNSRYEANPRRHHRDISSKKQGNFWRETPQSWRMFFAAALT